ncbi:nucleotidyl transferase AbiEii/AbiGii toxin family protein [Sanguibacter gelidistatuariae]|uniref:nucleotidyl transferase AbiEii/AbiGii toxin family protein n=1 Tax=Sanguibacter gelidistatuariae TaxID=1814289 RepID=UPI000AFE50FC|nr:nucleotidyl transferase AbiEii/AbiGii toxin family protein [Sanguibacter gelidistatuariae]
MGEGYPAWPTEVAQIRQRYSDVPAASLRVLTRDAFAAAKLSAWIDRGASRDLYDLWKMVGEGMITADAVARAWDAVRDSPLPT